MKRYARLGPATYEEALARRRAAPKKRAKAMERSWMKRRRARRLDREAPEEKIHKRMVREMRVCCVAKYRDRGRCNGVLQLAHLGPSGGMGAKHGDWTQASMMCRSHHDQFDGRQKPSVFDALTPEQRAAFADNEIHLAREFVAGRMAVAA